MSTPLPGPTVLLLGATGLVGRHALAAFLADPAWGRVVTLSRRPMPPRSARGVTYARHPAVR